MNRAGQHPPYGTGMLLSGGAQAGTCGRGTYRSFPSTLVLLPGWCLDSCSDAPLEMPIRAKSQVGTEANAQPHKPIPSTMGATTRILGGEVHQAAFNSTSPKRRKRPRCYDGHLLLPKLATQARGPEIVPKWL
jgi:hypothetical protein